MHSINVNHIRLQFRLAQLSANFLGYFFC